MAVCPHGVDYNSTALMVVRLRVRTGAGFVGKINGELLLLLFPSDPGTSASGEGCSQVYSVFSIKSRIRLRSM
jgi:hypothetical protein